MVRTNLPLVALVFAVLAMLNVSRAHAAMTDCNLSLKPGLVGACPAGAVGAASPYPAWQGGRVDPKTDSLSAVDAFGYCRYLGNTATVPIYAPFSDEEEWHAYLTNHPHTVYLIQCSRGGAIPMPANFGSDGASNQCVTPPPPQSITVPYQPANKPSDFTAPGVSYICHAADGTEFNEIVTATLTSHDSGYGPNDDIGWSFSKVLYSYNGICGPAKGVLTSAAPTTGLCRVGVASAVIGNGPYTWICRSGTGGGKNASCSSNPSCETRKMDEKPCRCEDGHCYRPVYWGDGCGHTWIDKSQICDRPEPPFTPQPLPNVDNTNQ